jgi:DNA-binding HxlR family transcriptional regulator
MDAKVRSDRILLDLISDKWTVLVLGAIRDHGRRRRFNGIRRDVAGISQKSLTQCLRRLERNGLIRRIVHTAAGAMAVEYAFTELGHTLDGPVIALLEWTATNADAVREAQAQYDLAVCGPAELGGFDDRDAGG